jgi:hypothetical protein
LTMRTLEVHGARRKLKTKTFIIQTTFMWWIDSHWKSQIVSCNPNITN